jgi:transposase
MFIPTRSSSGVRRNRKTIRWIVFPTNQLLEGATGVFGDPPKEEAPAVDLKELHAKIGQLALENDFLSGALSKAGLLPGAKK